MARSSATWRAVLPQLAQHYRVLAPDLPGHGDSATPRGDYSRGALAAWLHDLLHELEIERVTVAGQSLAVLHCVGHYPHLEDPAAVVDIIDDFVTTTPARR